MKQRLSIALLLLLAIILATGCISEEKRVQEGDNITVNYIGRLENGTIFDTSYEDVARDAGVYTPGRSYQPLTFQVGSGQMIPGFDKGVIGMKVNETKTVVIPPAEAYGEYDPAKITVLPKVIEIPLEETFNRTVEMSVAQFESNFGTGHKTGERLLIPGSEIHIIVDNITDNTVTISYDLSVGDTFLFDNQWNETVIGANETMITVRHDLAVGDNITLPRQPWKSTVTAISDKNATLEASEILQPEIQSPLGTASVSMNDTSILIDYNHPLAGKTLTFEITVVSIERG
ncbi:MAG: secreted protein containing Peptidyl-prolyl cis-trans isomerase, FKBP-type domain protein [Candidatus Syntrophoarchaeum caldarius]|uniref:Peptidyl-prolyl cis-trans isomerase n=1 Tax=Candidatus Syntropharchaeum caldarium TaxID=1838285 RepID=A0A1F2P7F3_9EURY|nr:MAG: secreted protein containing Peptidyl-prolyl cis-trans isomerase, FKBP-type domain protein [Candidatus Syntrophoarchaeum caldarius]